MSGDLFFDVLCGAVAFVGVIAVLFCVILTAIAGRERRAVGLFVLADLFCCLLLLVVFSLAFI